MRAKEYKGDMVLTKEGACFNYTTVATRQSSLVIKVNGQMHTDAFKRRLAFSFTVIILDQSILLLLKVHY